MNITVIEGDITQAKADAIVVNLFEGVKTPGGATGAVDKALKKALSDELAYTKAFSGKLGETWVLNTYGQLPARYVILVGLGQEKEFTGAKLRRAAAAAIRTCQKLKVETVASTLHGAGIGGFSAEAAARLTAEGTVLGSYTFTKRKSKKTVDEAKANPIETVTLVEADPKKVKAAEKSAKLGEAIATAVNAARDWVFDSPNQVTPSVLKKEAKALKNLDVTVLTRKEMEKLGMGSFLSVAKGSTEEPYLIHLNYTPEKKAKKKITLIGKGLTFDSGGLSLKPPASQELMKMDMAGAAAVLGVMTAINQLGGLDVQVDGFIGTCENMPSGGASKPGDIVVSMNGKTIEINNTDAEGRLVLIDVMTYAQQKVNPDEMIDLATLTGAQIIALGEAATAMMGTSEPLMDRIQAAGKHAGEDYWPLPLHEDYAAYLKSDVADLINAGNKGKAGTASAAMFLKEFVDDGRAWVHLDIAGPAYTSTDKPEIPKGATGVGVRTLLYYLYGLQ